ncbi:MAG: type II secretion system protein [Candidatus Omnitrophica bacterium]|nr:type II secretion system protein [Candidatus Omnitrophota bacterium]
MINNKARSLVTVMIVIAVSALLLRITIEQVIKISISQNESSALTTLKMISTAFENYARDNKGIFPANLSVLVKASPRYLDQNYIAESPVKGYIYSCQRLEPASYSCSAIPARCKLTGSMSYTVVTGGSLLFEECSKKE